MDLFATAAFALFALVSWGFVAGAQPKRISVSVRNVRGRQ